MSDEIQGLPPLFILQGLPGSGKSFWVRSALLLHPTAEVVSTDAFPGLYEPAPGGGVAIRPHLMGPAHGWAFRHAVAAAQARRPLIIDNTNTTVAEVAPYVLLAQAYGLSPILVRITADPEVCAARNVHGVPREAMDRLAAHLKQFVAPSHWKDIPGYAVLKVKS